ncbi:MarR family winged helix-turn-helix transcriptional regulator [Paenibacillus sp. Marseille-Q4541]|uniref:MarR family winged helix-turn-helix transcriptional regulator n=1 Tax=Paenibacillus sp. Marseille-Q4541 TaxID=2831522 RepID=UPI001BA9B7E6|nr:MarR family winged helix-turn-helix transcriptional regulator [Paenibacillus sp. Marseille-Q4541]
MESNRMNDLISNWLSLTHIITNIENTIEQHLQEKHALSLNEYYMLLFLSEAPMKKLRLQQLESMVGLSQSAMSRLVARFEAKGCGALARHACEEDRRSVYTALTAIGQEKVDKASFTFQNVLAETLPDKEMEGLLAELLKSKHKVKGIS